MGQPLDLDHLPHTLDGGLAARARIGLIVLATDQTIEHEWRLIFLTSPPTLHSGPKVVPS